LGTDTYFIITDLTHNKKKVMRDCSIALAIDGKTLCINGKMVPLCSLHITTADECMMVNGVAYRGVFVIQGTCPSQASQHKNYDKNRARVSFLGKRTISKICFVLPEAYAESKREPEIATAVIPVATAAITPRIRVLLDTLLSENFWQLTSESGFMVWGSHNPTNKITISTTELCIRKHDNAQLMINGRLYTDNLMYVAPLSGSALFNGTVYCGGFLVSYKNGHVKLINSIDLEEYVCSVLRTESWPTWPLEVHKVCAIACRSYAIAMMTRSHKLKKIYHIKNTNEHQTYSGAHRSKILRQAVNETRGVVMAYNKQPIMAMYDICCGGVVPAHIDNVNFQDAPYLARPYACSHCKLCKPYTWQTECALADFEKLVTTMVKKVSNIRSITISKKDKAGLVREIILKSRGNPVVFSGQKLYSLMKEVKSLCFQARKEGNKVVIKGRGFGHHLGLCQWGARQMVRDGWDYKRILQFYYPGTQFMRIT